MQQPAVDVDVMIIGGGINGVGIARDAAGRGLSVLLAEQGDFAGATSSASSKLIHGGLRYLEHYEFRLVSEALAERERLLAIAPHIAWPMTFIMPHVPQLRPRWMIRTGLFLYDRLGGRISLAKSKGIKFADTEFGKPLKTQYTHGFSYSDAWVDDARLVILNARSAHQHGAQLLPRTTFVDAKREGEHWLIQIKPMPNHPYPERVPRVVRAKMLVNASGPWVQAVQQSLHVEHKPEGKLRLVQGSHMVVKRRYNGDQAYILQHTDRRVIFMLPYERDYTLIGTTDTPLDDPNAKPYMTDAEVEYLCDAVNAYLAEPVTPADVVWRYSGVRPLMDDGTDNAAAVTRDYELKVDAVDGKAPLLTVLGGKLTTYRKLAEHALEKLLPFAPHANKAAWTHTEVLVGGDIPQGWNGFADWLTALLGQYPQLDAEWLTQLARRHGTQTPAVLGSATQMNQLGRHFGAGLYECEVHYLREHEWAWQAEDVLWRRTKCGLHMTDLERQQFVQWFDAKPLDSVSYRIA
jgi:glycerol-3-phosphate dehydrogenase